MKKILTLIIVCLTLSASMMSHAEKLVILLDWFANPDHAPLFVAKEQGFFKAQGLDVELLGPADPADPPKLVAAGKADIAITYEPHLLQQIDQGMPLIRIGTLIDKPLNCLVVLKSSGIQTIADLKGKTIAYSLSGVDNITLKTMLETHGISLHDVKHINVHYNLTQALLAKKVDAVTGMMRTFEPIELELAGQPARLFLPEKNGVPTYSELVFVIHKNNIRDSRMRKFLIALQQGADYLQKNPRSSWELFAKNHPELNDPLNQRAWFATLPYFTKKPEIFNQAEWLNFANYMQKNGLINNVKPINEYAVDITKG